MLIWCGGLLHFHRLKIVALAGTHKPAAAKKKTTETNTKQPGQKSGASFEQMLGEEQSSQSSNILFRCLYSFRLQFTAAILSGDCSAMACVAAQR